LQFTEVILELGGAVVEFNRKRLRVVSKVDPAQVEMTKNPFWSGVRRNQTSAPN
jgi:hypothetical protein